MNSSTNVGVNISYAERTLMVFVDDTGHEALAPGHVVYGLGGCAALGRDLGRLIQRPWRGIREHVTGSPDTALHANKFPSLVRDRRDCMEAVADFFRAQPFLRFGATITVDTTLHEDLGTVQTIKGLLQNMFNKMVMLTFCREVKVVFESSERANKLIEDAFVSLQLHRGSKPIPSECYFMPKSAAEPALEVADFVMHAVGRQARQNFKDGDRKNLLLDFAAVFDIADQRLVNFLEIDTVTKTADVQPAV